MQKEIPYSKINPRELRDLEDEFGGTLTPELAQCLIRFRINRDAIGLMLRKEASAPDSVSTGELSEIKPPEAPKSPDPKSDPKHDPKNEEEELKSLHQPGTRRTARKAVA